MRRLFDHGERTLSRALIARRVRFFFSLQVPSVDSLSVFRSSSEDFLFGRASHHERSSRRDLSKNVRRCRRLFENFQGFKQRSARRHYFLRHILFVIRKVKKGTYCPIQREDESFQFGVAYGSRSQERSRRRSRKENYEDDDKDDDNNNEASRTKPRTTLNGRKSRAQGEPLADSRAHV